MDAALERLINAFGVSGHEDSVAHIIKEELKDINCEIKEDKLGNLIVKVGFGSEKLMITAHMDQEGFIATYIDDDGFIRVGQVGDFHPGEFVQKHVKFEGGTIGTIGAAKDNPEIGDLFVDIGENSREEVLKFVKEGEVASFEGTLIHKNGLLIGPNLDNRVGCYILLRLIKEIKEYNKELYFVFSTQSNLGGRGARAAAYAIEPDTCIVLDVEEATDIPGGDGKIRLAHGPVIKILDRTLIIHHEVKEKLEKAAGESNVKIQYGISSTSTDGGLIHKEKSGIKTGVLSIPCRYTHSISEMINMEDVEAAISTLKNFV